MKYVITINPSVIMKQVFPKSQIPCFAALERELQRHVVPLSGKYCEECHRRKVYNAREVRYLCHECRKLLCENCLDTHKTCQSAGYYEFIDLTPSLSTCIDRNELASDYIELSSGSEDRSPANEGSSSQSYGRSRSRTRKIKSSRSASVHSRKRKIQIRKASDLHASIYFEFSVKQIDDTSKSNAVGKVLIMPRNIVVADEKNKRLKLFNKRGTFLSSIYTDEPYGIDGIARISEEGFVTCGGKWLMTWYIRSDTIDQGIERELGYICHDLSYNEKYYYILHRNNNLISLLGKGLRHFSPRKEIKLKQVYGHKLTLGWNIHSDVETHRMYVACLIPSGIMCMSIDGKRLWFTDITYPFKPREITEVCGYLCFFVHDNTIITMLSKDGAKQFNLIQAKSRRTLKPVAQTVYQDTDTELSDTTCEDEAYLKSIPSCINAYGNKLAVGYADECPWISLFVVEIQ